jgi:hypothetical protein
MAPKLTLMNPFVDAHESTNTAFTPQSLSFRTLNMSFNTEKNKGTTGLGKKSNFGHVTSSKQAVMMELPKKPSSDLKAYSCVSCRQRKVRCDRRAPCMNCTKAERQCNFIAPVRGKRKRTKPPRETLHARLKRYEEMLKAYGAKIEPSDGTDMSDSETESQSLNTPASSDGAISVIKKQDPGDPMPPKFIMKEGASRYYDRYS